MRKYLGLIALTTLFAATTSQAQSAVRPVELGVDAGVGFRLSEPNFTTIGIPAQSLRVGFYISDKTSIEPSLSLNVLSGNGQSLTTYNVDVGMLWHFASRHGIGSGMYVRPFLGLTGFNGLGESDTQADMGTGFGIKIPFANRLATRGEINFTHFFESGGASSANELGVLVGFSFFTR
jgi:hypothetical protein